MPRPSEALALVASLMAVAALAQEAPPAAAPAAAPPPAKSAAPRVAQVTPVRERVLLVGALAKRTGETRFLTLKPGQYIDFAGRKCFHGGIFEFTSLATMQWS
jgi:hypothetical protein